MYGFTVRSSVVKVFRFHLKDLLDVGAYQRNEFIRLAYKEGHTYDSDTRLVISKEKLLVYSDVNQRRLQHFIDNKHKDLEIYFAFSSIQQAKDWFDADDCIDMFINGCVLSELYIEPEDVVHLTKQVMLFTASGIKVHTSVVREIPFETLYPELTGLLY